MTTIAVVPNAGGEAGYRAIADGAEATGDTPGRALDALAECTGPRSGTTLVIVQTAADEFFTADQAELDSLVAAELRAATDRATALLRAVRP